MNEYQKERFVKRILSSMFDTVSAKKIAILGYAFKKDTNDARESPAIGIAKRLLNEKAKLAIYDPKVEPTTILNSLEAKPGDNTNIEIAGSVLEAVTDSHCVVVLTEWDEFKQVNFEEVYSLMLKPAWLFDGRNILNLDELKSIGFKAVGIGKG